MYCIVVLYLYSIEYYYSTIYIPVYSLYYLTSFRIIFHIKILLLPPVRTSVLYSNYCIDQLLYEFTHYAYNYNYTVFEYSNMYSIWIFECVLYLNIWICTYSIVLYWCYSIDYVLYCTVFKHSNSTTVLEYQYCMYSVLYSNTIGFEYVLTCIHVLHACMYVCCMYVRICTVFEYILYSNIRIFKYICMYFILHLNIYCSLIFEHVLYSNVTVSTTLFMNSMHCSTVVWTLYKLHCTTLL